MAWMSTLVDAWETRTKQNGICSEVNNFLVRERDTSVPQTELSLQEKYFDLDLVNFPFFVLSSWWTSLMWLIVDVVLLFLSSTVILV